MCCRYLYSLNGVSSHIECDVIIYIHQAVCLQMYNEIPILHTTSCVFSFLESGSSIYIHKAVCLPIWCVMSVFTCNKLCVLGF